MNKKKILILVEPIYLEDHSDPSEDTYLWAYKVKIKNNSKESIKLLSRHWKIFDSNGNHREVRGKGVVGEQPIIQPGDEFEYTSGTPLSTSSGIMGGNYQMISSAGKNFDINIPTFSLDSPYEGRAVH